MKNEKSDSKETTTGSCAPAAQTEEFLTKKELAARLRVNVRTIERWQRDGDVGYYKFRSVILFHWPEVLAQLKGMYRVPSRSENEAEAAVPKAEAQFSRILTNDTHQPKECK